ncbi:hypothetical protein [Mesobacillus harenae]|uniref:hypothetical protein n=1 Tax=Mesobacillus harenae TaxID=2213203 RepID=UPI0015806CCB|nr:hypothetical protein [Mesobacillus harenae]
MRWFFIIILTAISILFLSKGIELWSIAGQIENGGIGVKFIGIKIGGPVLRDSLPIYALGFSVASAIPVLLAINLFVRNRFGKKLNNVD